MPRTRKAVDHVTGDDGGSRRHRPRRMRLPRYTATMRSVKQGAAALGSLTIYDRFPAGTTIPVSWHGALVKNQLCGRSTDPTPYRSRKNAAGSSLHPELLVTRVPRERHVLVVTKPPDYQPCSATRGAFDNS